MYLLLLPARWLTFCGLQKSPFLPCDFHFESVLILLSTVTLLLLPVWYWPVALHTHNMSVLQFWHTHVHLPGLATYTPLIQICSYCCETDLLQLQYWFRTANISVSDLFAKWNCIRHEHFWLCSVCARRVWLARYADLVPSSTHSGNGINKQHRRCVPRVCLHFLAATLVLRLRER